MQNFLPDRIAAPQEQLRLGGASAGAPRESDLIVTEFFGLDSGETLGDDVPQFVQNLLPAGIAAPQEQVRVGRMRTDEAGTVLVGTEVTADGAESRVDGADLTEFLGLFSGETLGDGVPQLVQNLLPAGIVAPQEQLRVGRVRTAEVALIGEQVGGLGFEPHS